MSIGMERIVFKHVPELGGRFKKIRMVCRAFLHFATVGNP
jgi:hypothetical protein